MDVMPQSTVGVSGDNVMLHRMCSTFVFIFLVGGISSAWFALGRPLQVYLNAQKWPQVACTIDDARIIETTKTNDEGRQYMLYSAKITFSYELAGKRYTSDRVYISGFSSKQSSNRQEWVDYIAPFAERRTTVCYVNPADPSEAYLDRSLPLVDLAIGTLITAIFLGCAYLFWFAKGKLG